MCSNTSFVSINISYNLVSQCRSPPTSQLCFLFIPSDICPVLSKPPLLVLPLSAQHFFLRVSSVSKWCIFYHYVLLVTLLQVISILMYLMKGNEFT